MLTKVGVMAEEKLCQPVYRLNLVVAAKIEAGLIESGGVRWVRVETAIVAVLSNAPRAQHDSIIIASESSSV